MTTEAAAPLSSRQNLLARLGGTPAQIAALGLVAVFLVAFLIVPIVRVIFVAFTVQGGGFTLVNFQDFFATGLLRESFWNSVFVASMAVVIASLIAVPLATILARYKFRGAARIHTLGIVPLVWPP
ncbi:MAG: iron ABC transporter permease, partial [Pseudorhodoplanes sp.]